MSGLSRRKLIRIATRLRNLRSPEAEPLDVVHLSADRWPWSLASRCAVAISSLTEAIAYLKHATLGPRLVHCTELVLQISHRTLPEIFGGTDALKFCSCMTLFNQAAPDNAAFRNALENFLWRSARPEDSGVARSHLSIAVSESIIRVCPSTSQHGIS